MRQVFIESSLLSRTEPQNEFVTTRLVYEMIGELSFPSSTKSVKLSSPIAGNVIYIPNSTKAGETNMLTSSLAFLEHFFLNNLLQIRSANKVRAFWSRVDDCFLLGRLVAVDGYSTCVAARMLDKIPSFNRSCDQTISHKWTRLCNTTNKHGPERHRQHTSLISQVFALNWMCPCVVYHLLQSRKNVLILSVIRSRELAYLGVVTTNGKAFLLGDVHYSRVLVYNVLQTVRTRQGLRLCQPYYADKLRDEHIREHPSILLLQPRQLGFKIADDSIIAGLMAELIETNVV